MTATPLKAPFPYFGGKSRIAAHVWHALGQPKHYIEPFFGSGAVLLSRPNPDPSAHIESVNDKDGFIANVWCAIQYKPDETAKWCDWPVNHADLMARRRVLIANEGRLIENLVNDDMWCDPKLAGYWIWAASCWIGSGLTRLNTIPHLTDGGKGVHALGKRPHIYEWFARLSERLRTVRVVCGDWTRVCGGDWQDNKGICGMFFDPPYGVADRCTSIYHHDSTDIAADVMAWVRERGYRPTYRIVLAGYEEYVPLLADGWTCQSWKTQGGYGNLGNGRGKSNALREKLYFSPHCIKEEQMMFADVL